MARLTAVNLVAMALLIGSASAQNQPPASNPQAVTYAAQSIAAMTGKAAITDVTLTGTVTWYGGGAGDSGTVSLRALGTGESRMDVALAGGTHTEIRDAQTGVRLGKWISPNYNSGRFAFQNCWTDAVWFFPVLGSLAAGPGVVLSYVGLETRNGESVQHIQSYVYQPKQPNVTVSPQQLSTMDFYLDATTLLPSAMTFNTHPDNSTSTNLLVEVDFSHYQTVTGVAVPTQIKQYQQGALMIDVTVSGASFNTGIPLSLFAVN